MHQRSYTIVVAGELGPKFHSAFRGMRLEAGDGRTTISGPVRDQAQLRGVLDAIAAYNLDLVSVTLEEEAPRLRTRARRPRS